MKGLKGIVNLNIFPQNSQPRPLIKALLIDERLGKCTVLLCVSKWIVNLNIFPQNSQLKVSLSYALHSHYIGYWLYFGVKYHRM